MTRSTWIPSLLLLALLAAPARAAEPAARDPRIRSGEPELLDALTTGASTSPTLRRLVETIERSDVVVYLTFDGSPLTRTAGHVSFVAAAAGRRYLRIAIDRRTFGCRRIAILGHELQHAAEIAGAAWVTDEKTLASLYRQIGFRSGGGHGDCYDSRLAIEAGERVQRELLAGAASTLTGSR